MFCDEVLELVEPIAAGDLVPDARTTAHITCCAQCASALDDPRRLDRLPQGRSVPKPSAQFTSRIMSRLRRDRWRREQFLDTGFNVVVGLVALTLLVALWMVFSRSGLGAMSRDALNVLNSAALDALRRRLG